MAPLMFQAQKSAASLGKEIILRFWTPSRPNLSFPLFSDRLISPLMGHMLPKPIWGAGADEPCGITRSSRSFKNEITRALPGSPGLCLPSYRAKMCPSISIIGLFPYTLAPTSFIWYYIWSIVMLRLVQWSVWNCVCVFDTLKMAKNYGIKTMEVQGTPWIIYSSKTNLSVFVCDTPLEAFDPSAEI